MSMKNKYYLGIDNGLTVIKAVLFDDLGNEVCSESVQAKNHSEFPFWVERDMNEVWDWVCLAIIKVVNKSNVQPECIEAVGVTGHGDGVYLIDESGNPIRQGILSLDTRAKNLIENWRNSVVFSSVLEISGQFPFEGSPAPILAWLKQNESQTYNKIRWILTCKDWIRFKLTGNILTDFTEASSSFTNVKTQLYDEEIFELFDLSEMKECVPPVKYPAEVGGLITKEVSQKTGLCIGTPVCMGLHDVDACAIGSGCVSAGQLLSIMGTWSINQVTSDSPSSNPGWLCRNYYQPGLWVNLACSPASATNLDWFVRELCEFEYRQEIDKKESGFNFVNHEIEKILDQNTEIYFLPFLYGSPVPGINGSSFIGIQGWHNRAHLLKAVFEGVVFNHYYHIISLSLGEKITEVRLTGGGAKSKIWAQMFADVTNLPVIIPSSSETGALGAMICASVASGKYQSIDEAVENVVRTKNIFKPRLMYHKTYRELYEKYLGYIKALTGV